MLFYMPTKVYSETDCVKNHSKELASFGTKAMIVTGKLKNYPFALTEQELMTMAEV